MKETLQRYFIAILPANDISKEARTIQQEFLGNFNSKAALRSPPHITLHMPFGWKESKESELISALSGFFGSIKNFTISVDGFGAFPPRVIFMNVVRTGELLECQQNLTRFCRIHLNLFNAMYRDKPYHPHLTLAFRDLKKSAFSVAWPAFQSRSYRANFNVETAWLLKHSGKEWQSYQAFTLGRQDPE